MNIRLGFNIIAIYKILNENLFAITLKR